MGWLSKLRQGLQIAETLIEHARDIREMFEVVRDFQVRAGRSARIGDLNDSIEKLRRLDRRRG